MYCVFETGSRTNLDLEGTCRQSGSGLKISKPVQRKMTKIGETNVHPLPLVTSAATELDTPRFAKAPRRIPQGNAGYRKALISDKVISTGRGVIGGVGCWGSCVACVAFEIGTLDDMWVKNRKELSLRTYTPCH